MNAALITGSEPIPMMHGENGNMVSSPFATACPRHPSAAANKARLLVQRAGFFWPARPKWTPDERGSHPLFRRPV